jgi:hypothetical protein
MSTITREHLRTKTTPQLAALFSEVSTGLKGQAKPGPARDRAQRALAMIREEQASRGLIP